MGWYYYRHQREVMKKKMGRPRKGKEVRIKKSIRIEPKALKKLTSKYESLQMAFDEMLKKEFNAR